MTKFVTSASLALDAFYRGDARRLLQRVKSHSVQLILTSPPYPRRRKATCHSVSSQDFVQWMMQFESEWRRVLKPHGSVIIVIKEGAFRGQREPYVMDLIREMQRRGWLWVDEYIWVKKNAAPGFWPNRFRDGFERCLHFSRGPRPMMNQNAVRLPIGNWATKRLKKLSAKDRTRASSATGSGIARKLANWVGKRFVLPTNVLHLATECRNVRHPAAFPESLAEFFVKLFSKKGDVVLDPFLGSGTTCVVAKRLRRRFLGFEKDPGFCAVARERLAKTV